eukprot:1159338-Pelagomonas_calceolata.AAC.2
MPRVWAVVYFQFFFMSALAAAMACEEVSGKHTLMNTTDLQVFFMSALAAAMASEEASGKHTLMNTDEQLCDRNRCPPHLTSVMGDLDQGVTQKHLTPIIGDLDKGVTQKHLT